jgi:hypothetical protein
MPPGAERQVIPFDHQVEAVPVALILSVGHIVEAEVRVAELGPLLSAYEDVGLDRRSENPAVAEIKANRHTDRRINIVGIAPVARRVGRRVAPRVVIEVAITETEVGR